MSDDWEATKRAAQSPFNNEPVTDANEEPYFVGQDRHTQQVLLTDAELEKASYAELLEENEQLKAVNAELLEKKRKTIRHEQNVVGSVTGSD